MSDFSAIRGGRKLKEDEFKAHVAQAMRLENVGVFLGSGASCCAGGSTMQEIWKAFCKGEGEAIKWLRKEDFISGTDEENIEKLIDRLEIAWIEWERQKHNKLPELRKAKYAIYKYVIRASVLLEDLWKNPELHETRTELSSHKKMLTKLVSNRQPGQSSPWIFTTNYDLAIEWTAEALGLNVVNGFSGTHRRKFTPGSFDLGYRNIRTRGEARFGTYNVYLAKLHGSLTWEPDAEGNVLEWQSVIQKEKIDRFLSDSEAEEVPPCIMIYPGAAKFVESTGFLYSEMTRRFSEYLSRSNTCLIVNGYGFNDGHINKLIAGGLQNPTLQLIVYYAVQDDKKSETSSAALNHLLNSGLPQLTVCFGSPRAHFEKFVEDLPEPALIDEQAEKARQLVKLLNKLVEDDKKTSSSQKKKTR